MNQNEKQSQGDEMAITYNTLVEWIAQNWNAQWHQLDSKLNNRGKLASKNKNLNGHGYNMSGVLHSVHTTWFQVV